MKQQVELSTFITEVQLTIYCAAIKKIDFTMLFFCSIFSRSASHTKPNLAVYALFPKLQTKIHTFWRCSLVGWILFYIFTCSPKTYAIFLQGTFRCFYQMLYFYGGKYYNSSLVEGNLITLSITLHTHHRIHTVTCCRVPKITSSFSELCGFCPRDTQSIPHTFPKYSIISSHTGLLLQLILNVIK